VSRVVDLLVNEDHPLRAQRSQVGLAQLLSDQPLEQGLAELVTYLSLTDDAFRVVFDDQATDSIGWQNQDGRARGATLPRVTFAGTGCTSPADNTPTQRAQNAAHDRSDR